MQNKISILLLSLCLVACNFNTRSSVGELPTKSSVSETPNSSSTISNSETKTALNSKIKHVESDKDTTDAKNSNKKQENTTSNKNTENSNAKTQEKAVNNTNTRSSASDTSSNPSVSENTTNPSTSDTSSNPSVSENITSNTHINTNANDSCKNSKFYVGDEYIGHDKCNKKDHELIFDSEEEALNWWRDPSREYNEDRIGFECVGHKDLITGEITESCKTYSKDDGEDVREWAREGLKSIEHERELLNKYGNDYYEVCHGITGSYDISLCN